MKQETVPLQSLDELRVLFQGYIDNPGLKRFRNRALPNCGERTDEESVHEFMQQDDEEAFVSRLQRKFLETETPE